MNHVLMTVCDVPGRHSDHSGEVIREAIIDLGVYLYPEGGYGPSFQQWDSFKPFVLPRANTIYRAWFGVRSSHASKVRWAELLAGIGLLHPTHSMALGCSVRLGKMQDADVVILADLPRADTGGSGLPVLRKLRYVREWSVDLHQYIVVGAQQVWMVR